jgi:hypothetical protein
MEATELVMLCASANEKHNQKANLVLPNMGTWNNTHQ